MKLILADVEYVTKGLLNAFSQLHVARKLGPSVSIVAGMVDPANAEKEKTLLTVLMLSHISDEDTEFIIRKCLSVVTRKQASGTFAAVQSPDGQIMFDDMSMATILELTVGVIEENIGDFFRTALARLDQEVSKQL
jgi:hypothetical protein